MTMMWCECDSLIQKEFYQKKPNIVIIVADDLVGGLNILNIYSLYI